MPSKDSITKTIRINAEDLGVLEALMQKNSLSWSGAIHEIIQGCTPKDKVGCTPRGVPHKESKGVPLFDEYVFAEIQTMCGLMDIEMEDFFRMVCDALDTGDITVERGKIKGRPEYDLKKFEEACMAKNVSVDKMLERATQMVWKS